LFALAINYLWSEYKEIQVEKQDISTQLVSLKDAEVKIEKERSKRHERDIQKEIFIAATKKRLVSEDTFVDDGYFTDRTHTHREYKSLVDEHGIGALGLTSTSDTEEDNQDRNHKKYEDHFDDEL
jgi:hypothetical protein